MVSISPKVYFDALCFIEQCLPTRHLPIKALASACGIGSKYVLIDLLNHLVKDKIIDDYPFIKFDLDSPFDLRDLPVMEIPKRITKANLRKKSDKIKGEAIEDSCITPLEKETFISRIVHDTVSQHCVNDAPQRLSQEDSSSLKKNRTHQVKVMLSDVELRYLESLIGEIGDDKSSVFRNLLHANYRSRLESDPGQDDSHGRVKEDSLTKDIIQSLSTSSIDDLFVPLCRAMYEICLEISNSEWSQVKHFFQYPLVFRKYLQQGVKDSNIHLYCGEEGEADAISCMKKLARSKDAGIIAIAEAQETKHLRELVNDCLKGLRLLYDGDIIESKESSVAQYAVYMFKPG